METYNISNEVNIIEILNNEEIRIFEKLNKINNTITICNNQTEYFEVIETLKTEIHEENDWGFYYYNEEHQELKQFILHITAKSSIITITIYETENSEIKNTYTFMIINPS